MLTINEKQWAAALSDEFEKPYFKALSDFVENEYKTKTVFPPYEKIFNALESTPPDKIKAVIIRQDHYHTPGAAMGLCFSVPRGEKIPPSINNIFKAIYNDCGIAPPSHGDLSAWAKQGVLMLNTVLSVESGKANSHKNKGWETFTDAVIRVVNDIDRPVVFLLWGAPAQQKAKLLNNPRHLILKSVHPSPLSAYRGFMECGHFKKTNDFLRSCGMEEIDWRTE